MSSDFDLNDNTDPDANHISELYASYEADISSQY